MGDRKSVIFTTVDADSVLPFIQTSQLKIGFILKQQLLDTLNLINLQRKNVKTIYVDKIFNLSLM